MLGGNTNGRKEGLLPYASWMREKGCSGKTQSEIEIALVIGTATAT